MRGAKKFYGSRIGILSKGDERMTLLDQLKAAGLDVATMARLSHGVLTENKLRKHNSGLTTLSSEDRQLANRIIAEYRMMTEKVRFVVFSAVGSVPSK